MMLNSFCTEKETVNQQNEKSAYRVGENICTAYTE